MSEPTAAAPEAAPSAENLAAFNRHLKSYLTIGGLQVFFTLVAVIVSFAFTDTKLKTIAVLIAASINATIVAFIQMHLRGEKAIVWRFLFFTAVFFVAIFFLTLLYHFDPIKGAIYRH